MALERVRVFKVDLNSSDNSIGMFTCGEFTASPKTDAICITLEVTFCAGDVNLAYVFLKRVLVVGL